MMKPRLLSRSSDSSVTSNQTASMLLYYLFRLFPLLGYAVVDIVLLIDVRPSPQLWMLMSFFWPGSSGFADIHIVPGNQTEAKNPT